MQDFGIAHRRVADVDLDRAIPLPRRAAAPLAGRPGSRSRHRRRRGSSSGPCRARTLPAGRRARTGRSSGAPGARRSRCCARGRDGDGEDSGRRLDPVEEERQLAATRTRPPAPAGRRQRGRAWFGGLAGLRREGFERPRPRPRAARRRRRSRPRRRARSNRPAGAPPTPVDGSVSTAVRWGEMRAGFGLGRAKGSRFMAAIIGAWWLMG